MSMRIISFSEVRFTRDILLGKKTQTIRPLWKGFRLPLGGMTSKEDVELILKKPIHKVGDKVKLVYKQRGYPSDMWFCGTCGKTKYSGELQPDGTIKIKSFHVECNCGTREDFPKHFATAEITDVFEIEMENAGTTILREKIIPIQQIRVLHKTEPIYKFDNFPDLFAKADGFKNFEDMFQWFDKAYDLSQPKRFAVYRWKLI